MMRSVYFCLTSYEQNMTFYVKLQQIWAGPLSNNRVALVLLNRATVPHSITGNWDDIGIPENSVIEARDVWEVILIRLLFTTLTFLTLIFYYYFQFTIEFESCIFEISISTIQNCYIRYTRSQSFDPFTSCQHDKDAQGPGPHIVLEFGNIKYVPQRILYVTSTKSIN